MRPGVVVLCWITAFLTASTPIRGQARPPSGTALPRVVLVGDSIRLGYAPRVAERLAGKAVVISPAENGGDSANVLAHLDEWVLRQKPDVIHLNFCRELRPGYTLERVSLDNGVDGEVTALMLQFALDYLCSRPEVDPGRIGADRKSVV